MANKAPDKIPPGPKLDALTAEKVFVLEERSPERTGGLWVAGCKAPVLKIKCGVADGESFGFEPKLVCS
jgi:hypothetical protein